MRAPTRIDLLTVLQGANVALRLIQARILTAIAMVFGFTLFAWSMVTQTILAATIAALWGLIIFLPVLFTGRGGSDAPEERADRAETAPHAGED